MADQTLLDGLTDGEREAYLASQEEESELDESAGEEEEELGEEEPTDGEGETEEAANETEEVDDEPAAPIPQAPLLVAEAPADAEAQLQALATKKEELFQKFDDGELTAREYQAQLDAVSKEERQIERQLDRAEIAANMQRQQEQNAWLNEVNSFLDDHPEYNTSKLRYNALDTMVKEVAISEEGQGLNGKQILAKAHELVMADLGIKTTKEEPKPEAKPAPRVASKPKNIPPTLANVPAAEASETGNDRFAALDRLAGDPDKYEAALMKMSDAERDAYLQGQ